MKTYFLDALTNHYADFEGRANRPQFWWFQWWYFVTFVVLIFLMILGLVFENMFLGIGSLLGMGAFFVGTLIPSIAICVRRLHDINFSGWWILLNLIGPGQLVLLIFYCLPTVDENNQFGRPSL